MKPNVRLPLLTALLVATVARAPAAAQSLAPGAAIPPISLPDQTGKVRSFADLRGPKGLMLVFYRSADW